MRTSVTTFATSKRCFSRPWLGVRPSRVHTHRVLAAFTLTDSQGRSTAFSKPQTTVGNSPSCDVNLNRPKVEPQHALIVQKGKQTFLKPLVGESVMDDSRSWKDGVQLRPGVMYVLASGSRLAFGTEGEAFTIQFEEGAGSNPLVEMMMQGMLANSSAEVKKALGGDK